MTKTIDQSLEDLVVIANDIQGALSAKGVEVSNLSEAGAAIRTLGTGSGSVNSVNNIEPDVNGNVTVTIDQVLAQTNNVVAADFICTGNVQGATITSTSDKSKKTDLENVSNTYNLSTLTPYRYTLLSDGKKHVGLIAQDVLEVVPEAVCEHLDENKEKFLALDYNAIVALLVAKVNNLEHRVAQLESAVNN